MAQRAACYSSAVTSAPADCERGLLTSASVAELAAGSPIVLDSWHLYDGGCVGLDRHRARFTAGVREVFGVAEPASAAAYDHALGHLPHDGSWFPAFAWTHAGLRCAIRPFPVERLRSTTTLRFSSTVDARKRPDVKGFDYAWQLKVRGAATEAGYDDEVLTTSDGAVSETAFATLALWRDGELVVPDVPRLESVTLSVLRGKAGVAVRAARLAADDVLSAPGVVTLSALHGVRMVERLNETTYQQDPRLRDRLQSIVEAARRPVHEGRRACGSC